VGRSIGPAPAHQAHQIRPSSSGRSLRYMGLAWGIRVERAQRSRGEGQSLASVTRSSSLRQSSSVSSRRSRWTWRTGRHCFGNENGCDAGKASSLLPEDGDSLGGDNIMLTVPELGKGRIQAQVFLAEAEIRPKLSSECVLCGILVKAL